MLNGEVSTKTANFNNELEGSDIGSIKGFSVEDMALPTVQSNNKRTTTIMMTIGRELSSSMFR